LAWYPAKRKKHHPHAKAFSSIGFLPSYASFFQPLMACAISVMEEDKALIRLSTLVSKYQETKMGKPRLLIRLSQSGWSMGFPPFDKIRGGDRHPNCTLADTGILDTIDIKSSANGYDRVHLGFHFLRS
jgi:hypothetical protein